LIRRLYAEQNGFRSLLSENDRKLNLIHQTINDKQKSILFPNKEDVDGSSLAIIRLHDYYKLSAKSMADGIIGEYKSQQKLSGNSSIFF
jgi:hypothetical protein